MTIWRKVLDILKPGRGSKCCHRESTHITGNGLRKIAIVGSPNVGKSLIFNRLTGAYVTVSNYPGTTVEVSRGKAKMGGEELEVIDTPGMYSLLPITGEEQVARSILLEEKPDVILHVVDAKNLERMLPFTIQLIEAGFPVVLNLNMMDETKAAGIEIDVRRLEESLGIPVVPTIATTGHGIDILRKRLLEHVKQNQTAQVR
ncbi:MAG: GTP-binding protein [Chloroflexi bacterium]|nr:GTP-binding protein [Chloroflexota bacterium]